MRYYLPYIIEASDIELVGEFVQALKCLGVPESDADIREAYKFIINSHNRVTVSCKLVLIYLAVTVDKFSRVAGSKKTCLLRYSITQQFVA